MSNTNPKINRRTLRILLAIKNRAIDVEVDLRSDGKDEEANNLGLEIDNLDVTIRDLRGKILDDWLAKIPNLRKELARMNAEVQETIDDIKDDIETAQRVVKLIGQIEKVVGFLKPILL
jgi:peptidoglycan hydrolase CwlO-like protein